MLELGELGKGLGFERRGVAGDGGFTFALRLREPAVQGFDQLVQDVDVGIVQWSQASSIRCANGSAADTRRRGILYSGRGLIPLSPPAFEQCPRPRVRADRPTSATDRSAR